MIFVVFKFVKRRGRLLRLTCENCARSCELEQFSSNCEDAGEFQKQYNFTWKIEQLCARTRHKFHITSWKSRDVLGNFHKYSPKLELSKKNGSKPQTRADK